MLKEEIHSDDITVLNACVLGDIAATITMQKLQENKEKQAVTLQQEARQPSQSMTDQVGKDLESSSPR